MRLGDLDELADMLSGVRRRLDPKIYKTATEFFTRDEMLLNLEQMVRLAPTIDPVKHGRWVKNSKDDTIVYCDQCLMPQDTWYTYCPECGALMDANE